MKEAKGDVEENEMKSKPRMESKPQLLIDFTGDPEESRRRNMLSPLGGDGENRVTKTDETDGKKFEKSYKYYEAIRYLRSISNR